MREKKILYKSQVKQMFRDDKGHVIGVETYTGNIYSMKDIVICWKPTFKTEHKRYDELITKQHMRNDRNRANQDTFTIIPNHTVCRVNNKSDYISKTHLLN